MVVDYVCEIVKYFVFIVVISREYIIIIVSNGYIMSKSTKTMLKMRKVKIGKKCKKDVACNTRQFPSGHPPEY